MRISHKKLIAAILLALPVFFIGAYGQIAYTKADLKYVHKPDLGNIVMKVLDKKTYYYDSIYLTQISRPSPFFTDFFGLLPIKKVSGEKIKRDFVPSFASVISESDSTIELRFKDKWNVIFYFNSALEFKNLVFYYPHIDFYDSDSYKIFLPQIQEFTEIVMNKGLADDYLIENSFYNLETKADEILKKGLKQVEPVADPDLVSFNKCKNAVYIVPDKVHGDQVRYNVLTEILKTAKIDWLGIEMLGSDKQPVLDTYLRSKEGSAEFEKAKQEILENIWWRFSDDKKENPESNHYFRLIEMMRLSGKRVYALDIPGIYSVFRNGETAYGAKVRNYLWASCLPGKGKGIVFGGSAHFNGKTPGDFQDFLSFLNRKMKFFKYD